MARQHGVIRTHSVAELAGDLRELADDLPTGARIMVGLCGPPGTGKSTTAFALRDALGPQRAAVVQLDGFHLASALIAGTALEGRRGAIDTFDTGSFAALVERLRANAEPVIYAPTFDRELEDPINASMAVPSAHDIVLVEGNYLLADGADWARVRACLDEIWYLHTDDGLRRPRLLERHIRSGKTPDEARDWVARVDEANAALIAATMGRADRLLDLSGPVGHPDPPQG